MTHILEIKGKVQYKITLDPGVWIFDERRIDLDTYFNDDNEEKEEMNYEQKMAENWNKGIEEGATPPRKKRYEKEKVLTSSFGIKLEPFLNNAEPQNNATTLVLDTKEGNIKVPLQEASELILAFSHKGKPLKEDGPVHVYFPDGSNKEHPIKNVTGLIVE